jgi:hypothetical protein
VFAKLPDAAIAEFKGDPRALLTRHASAGLPLSTEVRSLLLTDNSLIDTIIDVAKNGNDAQKSAIGAGLAEASHILARTDPQLATTIQQKVAQCGLPPLITAYIAWNGIETGAVGGAGGGGGGSGGPTGGVSGGTGGGNNGSNGGDSNSTGNSFGGNSGAGNSGFANGGTSVSQTTSSSPTTP